MLQHETFRMTTQHPLEHLDSEALQNLIDRYYAGENVTVLLKEFDIVCHPGVLWCHFPPEEAGRDCPMCHVPLVLPRISRTGARWKKVSPALCLECQHVETSNCTCVVCSTARSLAILEKERQDRESIANFCTSRWAYTKLEITPDQLSAEAAIALLSLVRCGGWMDSSTVGAIRNSVIPLTPQESVFQSQLLDILIGRGLVAPLPSSPPGTFMPLGIEPSWEPESAHWMMLFPDPPAFVQQLERLIASFAWPDSWPTDCTNIWKKLATAECWEFCKYCVLQRNLPMPGATALYALIDNLLRDFSVSQCYQLIWASAADATDYRARKHITVHHAANYLIGACQRRADRSRAEGWPVKGFQRNFQLGRSQVSHVLHDVFLKQGEVGFFTCPSSPDSERV